MSDSQPKVTGESLSFGISDPPYHNYFYADQTVSCQTILTSPLPSDGMSTGARHRLLFAWPAGNSAAAVFFLATRKESDDRLQVKVISEDAQRMLHPVKYEQAGISNKDAPSVGVSCVIEISHGATLDLAILGSARSVRDFTEGGVLNPRVQQGVRFSRVGDGGGSAKITRTWFDEKTTTTLTFSPKATSMDSLPGSGGSISVSEDVIEFAAGVYICEAHLNYPQMPCLRPVDILEPSHEGLLHAYPDAVRSLAFLHTSSKVMAGAWRFLTYFGRDSMIAYLLLSDVLSEKAGEICLRAVLERIDFETGSVCHEETIGDYPAAQAAQNQDPIPGEDLDYKMIDTDFFLPIVAEQHLSRMATDQQRVSAFLRSQLMTNSSNSGKTYSQLLSSVCRKILALAQRFAESVGRKDYRDLVALHFDQPVGQWRDSNNGLGGGRYPFDVNTTLMPAALRAIFELSRYGALDDGLQFVENAKEWAETWAAFSVDLFMCHLSADESRQSVADYMEHECYKGPPSVNHIEHDVSFPGIALDEDGYIVPIMHTDACFRFFLLPDLVLSTNAKVVATHLSILDSLTQSVLYTFPKGLYTSVGILIASPAFSADARHYRAFDSGAYHGTVIWSWNSLVMLAKGLEKQLQIMMALEGERKDPGDDHHTATTTTAARATITSTDPGCYHRIVTQTKAAYTKVWDTIEANKEHLGTEVWSWRWTEEKVGATAGEGDFEYVPLSHQRTPDGETQTESNIVQLWSLAFLALERRPDLER